MKNNVMSVLDPSKTVSWKQLETVAEGLELDLRKEFSQDKQRAEKYSYKMADLQVDLSKNLVNDQIWELLLSLAKETQLAEKITAMFSGEHINNTEDRAVLHTALRLPESAKLEVDGQNVVEDVHQVLDKIYAFADKVRSGEWKGVTGKPIKTVVNIGIGGSDLGPVMVYEALKPYLQSGLECRFVSNIDPSDIGEKTADLDPETTLFIIASKTFTTLETITNAKVARQWLLKKLADQNVTELDNAVAHHFVAVSTNLEAVAEFGIDPINAFGFWNWVGGRYSVDSAVGTVLAIAFGKQNFIDFLNGFYQVDQHFKTADFSENVPVLMGLLNIWYRNFLGASSHAVLPYCQYLHRFPAYLQQLTMESNGKRVRSNGSKIDYQTGEIFWGEPGTNGQHAFYQLIHQGTQLIPADFIAFANPNWNFQDGNNDQHELFLSNFFAQTKALAFGKTEAEVRAEQTPENIVTARIFPGNKPTTSIMAPSLTPAVLGQLIALYEHITFVQGAVWGVNSFDQWGVELGKQLAKELAPAVAGDHKVIAQQDSSTAKLISYYLENRNA